MDGRSKQDEVQRPLFVYGTLLPGQPNAVLWRGWATAVTPAAFRNGRLYNMGGYPMLIEAGSSPVHGQLLTISANFYEIVLARLDFLEGYDPTRPNASGYRRVVRDIWLGNGRSRSAWVYLGQSSLVQNRPLIPQNSWSDYTASRLTDSPPLT